MSGVAASFHQATGILKLLDETKWTKDEMQRKFFARWGLLRQIAEAVDELGEEQVRAMHPLFYKKGEFPSFAIAAEYGYTVVEDVAPTLKSVGDLELLSFLREGKSVVSGEEMRKRAVEAKANLGLVDLKFVLAHQAEIPAEMRQFCLVFPGTVLRDPDGSLHVAYLRWGGGRWVVDFRWLDNDWRVHVRLPRCK